MSKKDRMADRTPIPPSMGPIFGGEGKGHFRWSGKLVWKSIWNEHKIIAWSHWPYVTPNDYQNIVFDEAVSLR